MLAAWNATRELTPAGSARGAATSLRTLPGAELLAAAALWTNRLVPLDHHRLANDLDHNVNQHAVFLAAFQDNRVQESIKQHLPHVMLAPERLRLAVKSHRVQDVQGSRKSPRLFARDRSVNERIRIPRVAIANRFSAG